MSEANFWQDKINSKNIIKEKKFFENLINTYKESIQKLDDLSDLSELALEEKNQTVQKEILQNIKDLKLNIAGKTGTTNKNTDTWFIGFTSNLLVGVYVGLDNPEPLGKYETGSKTALPIFKDFIKKAVKKTDARPFKAAKGTVMMVVDPITGQKAKFDSKNTIIEVYKEKNVIDGKILYSNTNRLDYNNILKFY